MTDVPALPPFWSDGPPPIDEDEVRPTVDEVAILERTRTVDNFGNEFESFTDDTRPNTGEVDRLIDGVLDEVLGQLPDHADPIWYPAIRRAVALRTATVIETSFFREQAPQTAAAWSVRFAADLEALRSVIPTATLIA